MGRHSPSSGHPNGTPCSRGLPDGPARTARKIWHCPEPDRDPDIFVYNAKAHPHISAPGELLISYNVNTFDFFDHFKYADIYRPRFIRLRLK